MNFPPERVVYVEDVNHLNVHVLTLNETNHKYSDEQRKVGQLSLLLGDEWVIPKLWNFINDTTLEDGVYPREGFILYANVMHGEVNIHDDCD
ncbi:MAG: hypothetical protein Tp152SUR00d2C52646391_69 [Prokaryotic dsDNA virus sp.]|nr:MAG: hypothetical protein Tp152SUR00d2C52646391_69 [Prokaryotic dsDNA virus sp.]|tara:strand:+ start:4215 stop:4490 length:276 start_codon:yes stop_codon:yes gene_type:complete